MPLPTEGEISLERIQTEYGGAGPTSISEYYRGAGYVLSEAGPNLNIPVSGQISFNQFYGGANKIDPTIPVGGTYFDFTQTSVRCGGLDVMFQQTYTIPILWNPKTWRIQFQATSTAAYTYATYRFTLNKNGQEILYRASLGNGQDNWRNQSSTLNFVTDFTMEGGDTIFVDVRAGARGQGSSGCAPSQTQLARLTRIT